MLGCWITAVSPALIGFRPAPERAGPPEVPRLPIPVQPRRAPLPRLATLPHGTDRAELPVTVVGRQAFG